MNENYFLVKLREPSLKLIIQENVFKYTQFTPCSKIMKEGDIFLIYNIKLKSIVGTSRIQKIVVNEQAIRYINIVDYAVV